MWNQSLMKRNFIVIHEIDAISITIPNLLDFRVTRVVLYHLLKSNSNKNIIIYSKGCAFFHFGQTDVGTQIHEIFRQKWLYLSIQFGYRTHFQSYSPSKNIVKTFRLEWHDFGMNVTKQPNRQVIGFKQTTLARIIWWWNEADLTSKLTCPEETVATYKFFFSFTKKHKRRTTVSPKIAA